MISQTTSILLPQFLADCTNLLFQLLHDAREMDSKMAVLNVMSLLMENVGVGIQPHVGSLLQVLPGLWAESGEKNATMLRSVIVSTLTNITKGLGSSSSDLHQFTIPVIQLATDTKTVSIVDIGWRCQFSFLVVQLRSHRQQNCNYGGYWVGASLAKTIKLPYWMEMPV